MRSAITNDIKMALGRLNHVLPSNWFPVHVVEDTQILNSAYCSVYNIRLMVIMLSSKDDVENTYVNMSSRLETCLPQAAGRQRCVLDLYTSDEEYEKWIEASAEELALLIVDEKKEYV